VLVETRFGAVCLDASFVRRTFAVMRMAVVVVMARVLNAVVGMRGFEGAIRRRVKSRAQQGRDSRGPALAGFIVMVGREYAGIATRHHYEHNGNSGQ
jgi:hypothetical protein